MEDQAISGSRIAEGPKRSRILVIAVAILALAVLVYAFAGSLRPALRVGDVAPGFSFTTQSGLRIDSEMLRGSVVVVNFFASWCKACDEEAANLEALWQAYRDRGVVFVGITYQDKEKDTAEFIEEHGLSFPIADDRVGMARKFGVTGVPETYVIDRRGTVIHKRLGAIEPAVIQTALENALNQ
jgi:cytochrome c biogenesis protein CcmG, thiol:disulfide interchange protein DsbE